MFWPLLGRTRAENIDQNSSILRWKVAKLGLAGEEFLKLLLVFEGAVKLRLIVGEPVAVARAPLSPSTRGTGSLRSRGRRKSGLWRDRAEDNSSRYQPLSCALRRDWQTEGNRAAARLLPRSQRPLNPACLIRRVAGGEQRADDSGIGAPFFHGRGVMCVADSTAHEDLLLHRRPVQRNITGVSAVAERGLNDAFTHVERDAREAAVSNAEGVSRKLLSSSEESWSSSQSRISRSDLRATESGGRESAAGSLSGPLPASISKLWGSP